MKKIIILTVFFSLSIFAQAQWAKETPTFTEISKQLKTIDVDDSLYFQPIINIKAINGKTPKVKVEIFTNGKRIIKQTMKRCYLYMYSNGAICVGTANKPKLIIYNTNHATMIVKQKCMYDDFDGWYYALK